MVFELYIEILIKMNLICSYLFFILTIAFKKSLLIYDNQAPNNQNGNQIESKVSDEEALMGGFQDGKGHEDVTNKIENQDILEDAIPQDELFNDKKDMDDANSDASQEQKSDGIEISDIENNNEETGELESNGDAEDKMSSVSNSICNEIDPDLWNQELKDSESDKEEAKTEKNEIDGTVDEQNDQCEQNMSVEDSAESQNSNGETEDSENEILNDHTEETLDDQYESKEENVDEILKNESTFEKNSGKTNQNGYLGKEEQNFENQENENIVNEENETEGASRGNTDSAYQSLNLENANLSPQKRKNEIEKKENLKMKKINETIENNGEEDGEYADHNKTANDAYVGCIGKMSDMKINNDINQIEKNENIVYDESLKEDYISQSEKNIIEKIEKEEDKKKDFEFDDCYKSSYALACSLCEQMRMILEPTKRSKFHGNFKNGKKINIRKIVPYIASQYTKDKIWLRRTKPSNRDYQIIIAIDDSFSMKDNNFRKMALTSLLIISSAFRLLEVGKVSIVSFGHEVVTLLNFDETCNEEKAKQIYNNLDFHQKATKISTLIETCIQNFSNLESKTFERLLLIISDGRGIYSEGENMVRKSIQKLEAENIRPIFIILDSKNNKDSITQINVPIFDQNSNISCIKSYMELFPFQYYVILRDVIDLPKSLSDITRQWIQLINDF